MIYEDEMYTIELDEKLSSGCAIPSRSDIDESNTTQNDRPLIQSVLIHEDELIILDTTHDNAIQEDMTIHEDAPQDDNSLTNEDAPRVQQDKPFELFVAHDKLSDDFKRKEFLRLRDSINRMNRGAVNNTFLSQAEGYVNFVSEKVEHVSFSCYWPTYDAMSDAQKAWYFYWRNEVRNDSYPKTDLSYIFVYIYELINNVGTEDGVDGFLKLCLVWGGYRSLYRALDRYMALWIEDYILINCKSGLPDETISSITEPALLNLLPDFIMVDYVINSGLKEVNGLGAIEFISRLSNYKFYASKFSQSKDGNLLLENIPSVISNVNKYMINKTGKGLFETYKPQVVQARRRMPYQNAVYQGNVNSIGIEIIDYTKNKPLRAFITSIIKQLENTLRTITGSKGKLGVQLPDDISLFVKSFITDKLRNEQAEKRAKISIDKDKIRQLIEDSNDVREKLLLGAKPSIEDDADSLFVAPVYLDLFDVEQPHALDSNDTKANKSEIIKPEASKSEIIKPIIAKSSGLKVTEEPVAADDDYFTIIKPRLTECQQKILTYLIENGLEASESEIAAAFTGVFVQTEIDGINDAAIDCLGDILVIIEDNLIKIEYY